MSNLSELLPSGGGQNVGSFVASGTLSNGQTVALKTDGTVEAIATTSYSESMGAKAAYNTAGEIHQQIYSSCYDSVNDKFVVFWRDSVGSPTKGYASVGSVSGTSISFGTAVEINSTNTYNTTCVYDVTQGKVIFIYYINGDQVYGKVGEVSGTSIINLGTQTVLGSINNSYDRIGAIYNPTEQATFIFCRDENTSSGYLVGLVFTVSGTTITTGTKTTIESNVTSTRYPSVAFDSTNNKLVTGYKNSSNGYAVSRVITIVGGSTRSISVGNQATAINGTIEGTATVYDPVQQRIVIIGTNTSASGRLYYANGTVSGTSITFATAGLASGVNNVTFADSGSAVYDATSGNLAVIYINASVAYYTIGVVNTANPDTSAFNTPVSFNTSPAGLIEWTSMAVGINGQVGCFYWDRSSDNDGAGSVLTIAHSSNNLSSFIGITGQAISDTATGNVDMLGGINSQQTSLVIGSKYYVQSNGTLGTTVTSTFAGQAISATTLNIRDAT